MPGSGETSGPVDEFDYIVVGGGWAGCVLAARLSRDGGKRVLRGPAEAPRRGTTHLLKLRGGLSSGPTSRWAGTTPGA